MKRTSSPSASSRPAVTASSRPASASTRSSSRSDAEGYEAYEPEEPSSGLRDAAEPVGDELVQGARQDECTIVAHAPIPFEPAGKLERVERIPSRCLDEATDNQSRIADRELVRQQPLRRSKREWADVEAVDAQLPELPRVDVGLLRGTRCEQAPNRLGVETSERVHRMPPRRRRRPIDSRRSRSRAARVAREPEARFGSPLAAPARTAWSGQTARRARARPRKRAVGEPGDPSAPRRRRPRRGL